MITRRQAERLPNYIKAFGISHGIRLLLANEKRWPRESQSITPLKVPGYEHALLLRDSISDHATFWQCIVRSQYAIDQFPHARALSNRYQSEVRSGKSPLIIDGGANIGLSAAWYATQFPEATIVAVEPDAENFAMLEKNTAPFGDRVKRVRGGVWHRKTNLQIMNPDAGKASLRVCEVDQASETTMAAYTIDDLCGMTDQTHPLIVKLDIEGAQASLFSANTDWLDRSGLVSLELDDWLFPWSGSSQSFFRATSHCQFDYLMSGESIFLFNHSLK